MKKRRKMSPGKKILIGIISLVLILCVGGYAYVHTTLNKVNNIELDNTDLEISPTLESEVDTTDITNIAIFGIDSSDGEIGRSDSIMVLTIDKQHDKLKVSSIIRDSYVEILGRDGKDKINHAYAFGTASGNANGGPTLAIKTLNKNFNLNIKDFVSVNFSSLPKLIDSVGGIQVNITSEEKNILNLASAGNQTLDGDEALAYSRIRHAVGGDFVRSERQRTVITALFNKFKSASVTSYPSLLDDLLPLVDTNLVPTDLLSLAIKANSLPISELSQDRFPRDGYGEGKLINGIYYYVFDIEETAKQMTDYIFLDK
ncbi:LCP family protein [Clostridium vincentii]|uniref:Transcriptional regulator LytR n=1 Tax=Clostridium vincentii TaxID=52704 RepID=A0A2T0BGT9_9CLOT|nr:LCP family protein [Clostridium vincentii]PRR83068.1 Transcriptional regulator LytR [Clostridium vincentii]